jgi:hypothetical protein
MGSSEQVRAVQNLVKDGCPFVVLKWQFPDNVKNNNLLIADLKEGKLFRFKMRPEGYRWEAWRDFSREQLLADEASDGWDLPNPKFSKRNEKLSSYFVNDRILSELARWVDDIN